VADCKQDLFYRRQEYDIVSDPLRQRWTTPFWPL